MGKFPSPAADYIEKRIEMYDLVQFNPGSTIYLQSDDSVVLVDRSLKASDGCTVAFEMLGQSYFGKIMGRSIITEDGDALEGDALDDVVVIGVVTNIVVRLETEERPTI
ncbi:hypothetical protein [Erwinia sp. V71]|uniref:hypothetical protein n=1 Tax=Erwinia sp. V71 TaxID=3369424 RepID=UPI003F5DB674